MHRELIEWFRKNKMPKYNQVQHLARALGVEEGELVEAMAGIISTLFSFGMSSGDERQPDPKELARGVKEEMEHVYSKSPWAGYIAGKIARDHLSKTPNYYGLLQGVEMESVKKSLNTIIKSLIISMENKKQ